jgi:predicted transcriptional regulator
MSDKQAVLDAVRRLPESSTLEQISEEIAILAAIRRGEEAAEAGHVISHDEAKRRSAGWVTR